MDVSAMAEALQVACFIGFGCVHARQVHRQLVPFLMAPTNYTKSTAAELAEAWHWDKVLTTAAEVQWPAAINHVSCWLHPDHGYLLPSHAHAGIAGIEKVRGCELSSTQGAGYNAAASLSVSPSNT
jgi:hypothetical protein